MNQMNMAGFNPGNPALANMPMPSNGPNGAMRRPEEHVGEHERKLNTMIYGYLLKQGQYDSARAVKNSGMPLEESALMDGDVNGVDGNSHTDSKDNIDKNRPDDLPGVKGSDDGQGGSFLLSWFSLFWDIFHAQRNKIDLTTGNAQDYVRHTTQQAKARSEQQRQMFQGAPVMNNMDQYQMMQNLRGGMQNDVNVNLRQRVLQNNRSQPTPSQIQAMRAQMSHVQGRRDPSMDMNGQRPRTPSASDHAPSPSKRQRMDGTPFDASQMMPNGRGPPPGMPMMGDAAMNANHLLLNNGINPGNLSDSQFVSFQQQPPGVQQKSIQVYASNLAKNQRQQSMSKAGGISDQGSPIMASGMDLGPEYYGAGNPAAMQMRGGAPPNVPNGGAGGNHALQDYQMQLMLLEQQNKKRLLMARQEQDGRPEGQPGMPGPGFMPAMSPGSRGGPSPGPNDNKRGTPKMNQVGLPGGGSPMPDGSMRNSPGLNFNPMEPGMYNMNANGMRPPPSSTPAFAGQSYTQQQMETMARAGRGMPNGWQPPQGQPQMMGQPQGQQPPPMGTPQTRNTEMPPPAGVPANAGNGRPASPAASAAAPPTPQTTNKAAPKGKKEPRDRKKPTKKGSIATPNVAATPVSEAENANPPTPTPATPSTPKHIDSFGRPQADSQAQPNMTPGTTNGAAEQIHPPQPDPNTMPQTYEAIDDSGYSMPFNNDISGGDVLLDNFDFEQFLQNPDGLADFQFDPAAFENDGSLEAGMTGT